MAHYSEELHDARMSRQRMATGTSLLIRGDAKEGDGLLIRTPTDGQLYAEVIDASCDGRTIMMDGRLLDLGRWQAGDDPLPEPAAAGSRWTARPLAPTSE